MKDTYEVQPVGCVHRDDREFPEGDCVLEVRPELEPALLGIEPGDRVQVMWWMHRLNPDERSTLRCHPMGNRDLPVQGVFALRSPMRPNPIGSTVVEVKAVEGRRLTVAGLDALDGSPVVDIKMSSKRQP